MCQWHVRSTADDRGWWIFLFGSDCVTIGRHKDAWAKPCMLFLGVAEKSRCRTSLQACAVLNTTSLHGRSVVALEMHLGLWFALSLL